jgi:hypothetical protein
MAGDDDSKIIKFPKSPGDGPRVIKRIGVVLIASAVVLGLLFSSLGFLSYVLIFLVLMAVALGMVISRIRENSARSGYRELLKMVLHDEDLAERLILAELKKSPELKRPECIKLAYQRLYYDRSR